MLAALIIGLELASAMELPWAPMPALAEPSFGAEPLFDVIEERGWHLVSPAPRERSKKEVDRAEKLTRAGVHLGDAQLARAFAAARSPLRGGSSSAPTPVGFRAAPVTTLFNLWTHEALPLLPGLSPSDRFHDFLRDHYTNQATRMDTRLIDILAQVARHFTARRIDVVSGFRSPKYNLMLRKKGREVARGSQHPEGTAVDFRIRGVPIKKLAQYVRSLQRGGVGLYPRSQFVHSDTGKVRYWTGS